ncbi:MAG: hypothetical protein HOE80_02290 [Candidatus Magasanikbacteria bacterium]|jgi:hypothetical protein|nr:hypothetical protein [Candidatus Magasanikbacteria bacterium]MBT4071529.1 hypothetical protein [Candidatus Magasanikbacteria bacterium]
MKKLFSTLLFSFLFIISFGLFISPAEAKDDFNFRDYEYRAQFVSQSTPDPIEIEAGETKSVTITFKNTGTKTWSESAINFVSAYAVEMKYRDSDFVGPNWLSTNQTAKMKGYIPPGGTGELTIELTAPDTAGTYKEWFHLAVENHTWLKGGYFFLKINVVPATKKEVIEVVELEKELPTDSAQKKIEEVKSLYQAKVFANTKKEVSVSGGEVVSAVIVYRNMGEETWDAHRFRSTMPTALAGNSKKLSYADKNWKNDTLVEEVVSPVDEGGFIRKEFTFRAPAKKGDYDIVFFLEIEGERVEGSEANVHLVVTKDAAEEYTTPSFKTSASVIPPKTYTLKEEPKIRVGVWKIEENSVIFQSTEDSYIIYSGDKKVDILPKGKKATLTYSNGVYALVAGNISVTKAPYIRLVPEHNDHAIFALLNYERKIRWKGPTNFNRYHGAMEFRSMKGGAAKYVINELFLEDYMKGMGENSNGSNKEYLRSQAVAQRSYAYNIKASGGRYPTRYFDVVAHTGDQLYLGAENEKMMNNFIDAVNATRGYVVTYNDEVVTTPYFGHSDGRTRSWVEAGWGRTGKPWLVSVKTEYDAGKSMYGHGVGMSQLDAAARAEEEGLSWKALLTYYYTGTEVEKLFK